MEEWIVKIGSPTELRWRRINRHYYTNAFLFMLTETFDVVC